MPSGGNRQFGVGLAANHDTCSSKYFYQPVACRRPLLCLQTLQRELQGHKSRIEDVLERAAIVASLRSLEADYVRAAHDQLAQLWGLLWAETERRQLILDAMYQAQQYFFDTAEVEAWLSEQELHMMNEEKGKVCACVCM